MIQYPDICLFGTHNHPAVRPGSGIGLSLCKQIVRSHNGRTQIESTAGHGTRVIITL
ncbi:MAG: hypothetical protein GQ579_07750 [Bacteroidales bacterium]|nr:hypothetical protein [Bacteroidales bacterium]